MINWFNSILRKNTAPSPSGSDLRVWMAGDPHAALENQSFSYNSIQTSISDIDSEQWDFGIIVGDFFNDQAKTEVLGQQMVTQFNNALSVHNRSDIYTLLGNHDASDFDDPNGVNWIFRKYIDSFGENTADSGVNQANMPITPNGDYAGYTLESGNLIFVVLSDRNDYEEQMGEANASGSTTLERWRLAGGMSLSEWQLLVNTVLKNPNKIIVVCFHHAIYETLMCSGFGEFYDYGTWDVYNWENFYGGCFAFVENQFYIDEIQHFISGVNGSIDFWLSGHVHHRLGSKYKGRGEYIYKDGIHHYNVCQLTRNLQNTQSQELTVHSFFFNFLHGQNKVTKETYVHEDKINIIPTGYYTQDNQTFHLSKTYDSNYQNRTIAKVNNKILNISFTVQNTTKCLISFININTGVLIVRKTGSFATFTPVADTAYYRGQALGDGEVVFMGTAKSLTDFNLESGTTYYYSFVAYNAGDNQIKYSDFVTQKINTQI